MLSIVLPLLILLAKPVEAFFSSTQSFLSSRASSSSLPPTMMTSSTKGLELWIDNRQGPKGTIEELLKKCEGASRILVDEPSMPEGGDANDERLMVLQKDDGGRLLQGGKKQVGVFLDIENALDVGRAIALVGSVDWVCMSFVDGAWIMIGLENIISVSKDGPTRICARINHADQVQGAASALQLGADALLIEPDNEEAWQAARLAVRAKGMTGSAVMEEGNEEDEEGNHINLTCAMVESVEPGGVGDRVCLDLIQLLKEGEGMLVGSSALGLVLVQAEVMKTAYVPSRPFRVNAGPVHSYVLMEDGSAKYLCEVQAGDKVRVVDHQGNWRPVSVGRCKIESRPHVKVTYSWGRDDNGSSKIKAQVFLQQAETVRFCQSLSSNGNEEAKGGDAIVVPRSKSVTDLKPGDQVLVRARNRGTHLGRPIAAKVSEK